jgi:hypothetical protein
MTHLKTLQLLVENDRHQLEMHIFVSLVTESFSPYYTKYLVTGVPRVGAPDAMNLTRISRAPPAPLGLQKESLFELVD